MAVVCKFFIIEVYKKTGVCYDDRFFSFRFSGPWPAPHWIFLKIRTVSMTTACCCEKRGVPTDNLISLLCYSKTARSRPFPIASAYCPMASPPSFQVLSSSAVSARHLLRTSAHQLTGIPRNAVPTYLCGEWFSPSMANHPSTFRWLTQFLCVTLYYHTCHYLSTILPQFRRKNFLTINHVQPFDLSIVSLIWKLPSFLYQSDSNVMPAAGKQIVTPGQFHIQFIKML